MLEISIPQRNDPVRIEGYLRGSQPNEDARMVRLQIGGSGSSEQVRTWLGHRDRKGESFVHYLVDGHYKGHATIPAGYEVEVEAVE